ncbi:MAG: hypothetical protein QM809_04255 [Gordonia sp. (in: high G+C Gram-positive bacteria)]
MVEDLSVTEGLLVTEDFLVIEDFSVIERSRDPVTAGRCGGAANA